MNKVITALSNEIVNNKLKEYSEINVIMNDIQYQDGIMEALEIDKEIKFIILSELLPGQYSIKELIEKIKNIKNDIKLIIILEKENKELENYLFAKGNINIFYNNEIEIKEIVNLIINKNKNEKLEKEINELKKIIFNNEGENNEEKNKINKNNFEQKEIIKNNEKNLYLSKEEKIKIEKDIEEEFKENFNNNIFNKIIKLIKKEKNKKENKLIIISGISGVGKSVFTANIAQTLKKQKNKVLIIDFDFVNNSIQTLFGIKDKTINKEKKYLKELNEEVIKNNYEKIWNQNFYNNENKEINELIIKINSKIDLISKINLLFLNNEINDIKLLKIINELKEKYNFILIDLEIENKNYIKSLLNNCDKIIFLTEPNIIQIKKTKNILKEYIEKIKIEKEKIYILFNKVRKDSISFNITKEILKEYNFLGKINFIKNYNILINQNMKTVYIEKLVKEQYWRIGKKIGKNIKIKKYYLNRIE